MTPEIEIIKVACDSLAENGYYDRPRIELAETYDLSGFERQESDIPHCEFEWVNQSGPGISGDDYHGTMAWPLGNGWLFVCDYAT